MNKNVNHCDLKTMTKQKRENDMKTRKIKRYKNTKHTHTHMATATLMALISALLV